MDDGASLICAVLDLALDHSLDLSGVDRGDIRDLHAELGRIIEDRAI